MAKPKFQVFDDLPTWQFDALKASIGMFGVLLPVVKDDHGRIIDGHQRERACRELGIRDYPVLTLAGLTREQERDHALMLNLVRRRISQEQMRGLIEAELRRTPDIASNYLAVVLGVSGNTVEAVRRRLIATSQIAKFEKFRGRDGKARRVTRIASDTSRDAQRAQAALRVLGDEAPGGVASQRTLRTRLLHRERADYLSKPDAKLPANISIEHADFRAWDAAKPGSVDLILTDPPWLGEHADIRRPFTEFAAKVLKLGGLLLTYIGQFHLPEWFDILGQHLRYRWLFAAVNGSGDAAVSVMRTQRIRNGWRPLVLFSKGVGRLPMLVKDVVYTPVREKGLHQWQQPVSEACYYVDVLCPHGGTVCDPFVGSGTVAAAVSQCGGGRRFIGCDSDAGSVRLARRRVAPDGQYGC